MKKSINLILIGVLAVASLLLALPFTPLRNSFGGITSKYMNGALISMGVDFDGKIKNARQITGARSYQVAGLDDATVQNSKNSFANGKDYSNLNVGNGYSVLNGNVKSTINKGNSALGNLPSYSGLKGRSSTGAPSLNSTIGIASTSTDLTTSTTTKPQAGPGDPVDGGTHPGVDPTNPPSLPIGDGLNFMLILAGIFAAFKIKSSLSI